MGMSLQFVSSTNLHLNFYTRHLSGVISATFLEMASASLKRQHRTWIKDNFLISTDPSQIPIPRLNEFFARDDIYWATPLPEDLMQEMVHNSLCFGLYEISQGVRPGSPSTEAPMPDNFIGLARCVTDFTTFMYLTDVYIEPQYQGKGLGTWMMECVLEVIESIPYLRRILLATGDWKRSVPFYEKILGMEVVEGRRGEDGSGKGLAFMMRKGRAHRQLER